MNNFNLKKKIGDHSILLINNEKYKFKEYFVKLFNCEDLTKIHLKCMDYSKDENQNFADFDTDLHQKFYNDIKNNNNFKKLYCELIQDIFCDIFPEEKTMIFQSFPSLRIQFFNNVVVPPHYDADDLGKHPIGEKNFLLPITRMFKSNRLFIESEPGKKDFEGIDLDYGELFYFNGNLCTHYNMKNIEDSVRISLDFRVILLKDYLNYLLNNSLTYTNPRDPTRTPVKMLIGGYYQVCFKKTLERILDWHYNKELILQTRPNFDMKEADAVYEYMKGDNFFTEYKYTTEFENKLSEFIGSKYCVAVNNGTLSLLLALMALNIGSGDEVIVPNYTMIASINSIKAIGATPIICDVDNQTFTLSLDIIKRYVNSKTKAIMHVSLNNRTKNLEEISKYCNSNNIFLIEDAAQSLGCFLNGKHIGTFGIIGSFSLSTPKIISTGQGGFLVTDNYDIYKKMCMIKNFGRKEGGIDNFEIFGLNFKFTDIQAIIGIEQMKKINDRIFRMKEIFNIYYQQLKDVVTILKPQNEEWFPWFIEIIVDDRENLINFLKIHNIQTRKTYPQISSTPMYYNNNEYINSKYISDKGLFLPSHTLLEDKQINYICDIIKVFYSIPRKKVFITLTCYNISNTTSPWFIQNQNHGIGNMLFQIASGLYYAYKNDAELYVPSLNTYLKLSNLKKEDTIFSNINSILTPDYNEKNIICAKSNREYIFNYKFYDGIHFCEYFENFNNFNEYKFKLLEYFRPNVNQKNYLINKYPYILDNNIASLHIRRGKDYEKIYSKNVLEDMEKSYYRLIDYMIENKNICKFFILTNDKLYCNNIFNKNEKYKNIIFYYSNELDFYDVWIISLIKNNILSQSTLSWWGSYLNENTDKVIIGHKMFIGTFNPEWLYIE